MAGSVLPRDLKMFRFIYTRGTSRQNIHLMSIRNITTQPPARVCSFCNFCHCEFFDSIRYPFRHFATIDTREIHVPLKKKIKYRYKKYAELLEVTDQATNNKKAKVHKLNSTNVSVLIDKPDITLDKLHKINDPYFSKKKYTTKTKSINSEVGNNLVCTKDELDKIHHDILEESSEYLKDKSAIIEELKESGLTDQITLIKNSSFLKTLQQINKNDEKNEKSDNSEQLIETSKDNKILNQSTIIPFTKENTNIFEDSLSVQNLLSTLIAHIDAYIHSGLLNKAFKLLMLYRTNLKHSKISTIAPYNLLIEAYSCNADLGKVFEIYNMIKIDFVKPNAQTYIYMFNMIAKMKNKNKQIEVAAEITVDMNHKNISFNEVMNTPTMNALQRDAVLHCIRLVDPQYYVEYNEHIDTYDCKLLSNLTACSSYQSPANKVLTINELREMLYTQLSMESQYEVEVKSIAPFTEDPDIRQEAVKRITEWEKSWESSVMDAFVKNLCYLKQKENRYHLDLKALHPFLQVLPKEVYVNAILREIRKLATSSDAYSNSLSRLYLSLGKYIYKKYEFQQKKKTGITEGIIQVYKKYLEWYLQTRDPTDKIINGRMKWQQLAHEANKSGLYFDVLIPDWPYNVMLNVGKFLYNIIVNNVKIPHGTKVGTSEREIPAFYFLFRNKNKFLTEEIKPHPHLYRLFKESHPETLTFETVLLPTCSPPRPWVNMNTGGYLFNETEFVRVPHIGVDPIRLLKNTPVKQLYPALDCLNQLGSIPWKINQPMLDILIKIFRENGSEELHVPQPPSMLPSLSELTLNDPGKDKSTISRLPFQLKRRKNEMYSLWCDCLYKLSIANHFRDKVFWLPHNLDFRGRAYPVPPHLNHLSSDLGRSILIFAQGKPLGPNGLDWLKIHTINLTGMKKRESIEKRLKFANEILDLILDSARKPLTGDMWWTKSDEPWQTLAACKEINNALQSQNIEEYITGFPIHQDGSCNGLQHYAALGRDQIGAESVNLYPSSTPQDVYSVVASMVEEYRRNDAANGNETAKALEGHISRKVIKQTVMTTVYGVTKFGARLQITRQLSDLKDFPQDHIWNGSLYLVGMTFKSLRTMFTSAKEIQDWFTESARVISTRCNQYVQWVTPLGLPVLQPYCKRKPSQNSKFIRKPDTLKQRNAFPPNFIHSLDSCHMMLTSLHSEQAGITFMSVHDCFWTHPCSVDIMSRICREQFVALHSEPILEDLSNFLYSKYQGNFTIDRQLKQKDKDLSYEIFKNLPKKGDFDINKVLFSKYFFS